MVARGGSMTITEANFLDIGNLLINEIVGSVALFIIIGLIVINYYGVKSSLPFQVNLVNSFMWSGLVISYAYNELVWMLSLFVIAIIFYALYPKLFKR
jgi:hypothetical protein